MSLSWHGAIVAAIRSDERGRSAIARVAGVTAPNLKRYEDTGAGLSAGVLERLAGVLGLSLSPARGVLLPAKELPSQPEIAQTPTREVDSIPRAGDAPMPMVPIQVRTIARHPDAADLARGLDDPHARDEGQGPDRQAPTAPPSPTHQPSLTPRAGDRRPLSPYEINKRKALGMPV